jgi:hypothetical protein
MQECQEAKGWQELKNIRNQETMKDGDLLDYDVV